MKKNYEFFKIAKGGKFDVECDWYSKNQQNVQSLGFLLKTDGFSLEKVKVFQKSLQAAKSPLNAPELVKFNKTFAVWAF